MYQNLSLNINNSKLVKLTCQLISLFVIFEQTCYRFFWGGGGGAPDSQTKTGFKITLMVKDAIIIQYKGQT